MIYGVDCGHCTGGSDTGAQGTGRREENLTREVGYKVMDYLKGGGHTVIDCTCHSAGSVSQSLRARYTKANDAGVDVFLSIHFNASGGKGSEIYTYGANKTPKATRVLNNLTTLGFVDRGIKDGSGLSVIRNTKAEAMLIEVCFIDTQSDMALYDKLGADAIAKAIALGVIGAKIKASETNTSTPTQTVAPQAHTSSLRTWEKNIDGDIIRELQTELNNQFGANLKVDGYCGDSTMEKLVTVRRGARGNLTRIIQDLVRKKGHSVGQYGSDGVFGGGTVNAITNLQKAHGLTTDGIVGRNTWEVLLRK